MPTFIQPSTQTTGWKPVTKWLNQDVLTAENAARYCDGVTFRQVGPTQFQTSVLAGNFIDMDRYLVADGTTDNSDAWERLMTYLDQQNPNSPFWLTLVFSSGRYYFSRDLVINDKKFHLTGPGGELYFGAGAGPRVENRNGNDVYCRYLRFTAKARDDSDGIIMAQDGRLAEFVNTYNVPMSARSNDNITIGEYLNDPAHAETQLYSPNPFDYTGHAFYSTGVVRMQSCVFTGFASGVFLNGKAIGDLTNPEAPDGYNTSMSILNDVTVRRTHGPGIAVFGADGNHVRVDSPDCRDTTSVGFLDISQSGAMVTKGHFAINHLGDFWMLSQGPWRMECTYSEVNPYSTCVTNGYGTVTGGPLNSTIVNTSGNVLVQRGSYLSDVKANITINDKLTFNGPDNYHLMSLFNEGGSYLHWDYGGAPDDRGLVEIFAPGLSTAAGRIGALGGMGTQAAYIRGVCMTSAESLADLYSFRTLWREGDIVWVPNNGTGPLGYRCTGGGTTGGLQYSDLENLQVFNDGGPQNFRMTGISKVVLYGGQVFILNGQPVQIANIGTDSGVTRFSLFFPGRDLGGQPGVISFSEASFQAFGQGTGTTEQRPVLRQGKDHGYPFYNQTLSKMEHWNGTQFA